MSQFGRGLAVHETPRCANSVHLSFPAPDTLQWRGRSENTC